MVKSGVLYYVVFILLLIWFICLGIILVVKLEFVVYAMNRQNSMVSSTLRSAISLYKSNADTLNYEQSLLLNIDSSDIYDTKLSKKHWGFYDILHVNIQTRFINESYNYLTGADILYPNKVSLYMADENKYLTICGSSEINGDVYLPKLGIRKGYIEGKIYSKKELVNGVINKSKNKIPEVDNSLASYLKGLVDDSLQVGSKDSLVNYNSVKMLGKISNTFKNKSLVLFSSAPIVLKNQIIDGNVIIVSRKLIVHKKSALLKNVILVAPRIRIDDESVGSFQALALDTIWVGKKCNLIFPSVLAVINTTVSNSLVHVSKKSKINGIVYLNQETGSAMLPTFKLDEDAIVWGQVYCNGIVKLKSNVYGSLYCKRFILETQNGIYENHLLDNKIDCNMLSGYYAGFNFLGTSKYSKIIECLN